MGEPEEPLLRLGVCAMAKKARSKPMRAILERIEEHGGIEIVVWTEPFVYDAPVEEWPVVDCMVCFHSNGFPLEKAEAYVSLRSPLLINSLKEQWWLLDRRKVSMTLERVGVPAPRMLFVNRDAPDDPNFAWTPTEEGDFVEGDDFVAIGERKIIKPFVEKPVDANRHDVRIYFPSSAGGGCKSLFRKVGDRSGQWNPDINRVRRDGSYVYEAFVPTGGIDVKVYAIAPSYAHAEARKSPAVDGKVERDANGKEVRHAVRLLDDQKRVASKITSAFRQGVCGFDMLYTPIGTSYVCDVNGFSFVKGSEKYLNDAAALLHTICMASLRPARFLEIWDRRQEEVAASGDTDDVEDRRTAVRRLSSAMPNAPSPRADGVSGEELLAVLIVARHGDRTPKMKCKVNTGDPALLSLYHRWAPEDAAAKKKEVKLKRPRQLRDAQQVVAKLVEELASSTESSDLASSAVDDSDERKLKLMHEVLQEGGHFSGLNRKLQLKVKKSAADESGLFRATKLQAIMKYGGLLTPCGCHQAEAFGRDAAATLYPGGAAGLMRLHSTFRLDFRCYTSDEGRVQQTAAHWIRTFLNLDTSTGDITPILFNYINIDTKMLDEMPHAVEATIERARARIGELSALGRAGGGGDDSLADGLSFHTAGKVADLQPAVKAAQGDGSETSGAASDDEREDKERDSLVRQSDSPEPAPRLLSRRQKKPALGESLYSAWMRWSSIRRAFLRDEAVEGDSPSTAFDLSKISDIFDSAYYDTVHNAHLRLPQVVELFAAIRQFATRVVPNEYGGLPTRRLKIGSTICAPLLSKLTKDIDKCLSDPSRPGVVKEGAAAGEAASDDDGSRTFRRAAVRVCGVSDEAAVPPQNSFQAEEEQELLFLDVEEAESKGIRTARRRVLTRAYFTSESHIMSFVNVLRTAHLLDNKAAAVPLVSEEAEAHLAADYLGYLSAVVIRVLQAPGAAAPRVEMQVSAGASLDGTGGCPALEPRRRLDHPQLTLERLHAALRSCEEYGSKQINWGSVESSAEDLLGAE
ncbi:hypothetical protein EMIHUDRAFT_68296 [Emiliania huxleyi CCMP1516]|uniref:Inositol hexakisphosphate and diphosphoinositol-pentakisphosphate kinase n=2 Tax=Emiliania huxleyi TaxID=2903 RepID=A0A0D3IAA6_EMIH1|nr:hypothetical protein EMIHUDRAFT_68296 [Emiliania huxleyi CCMP1516]EOD08191.1 hypothetical protein EMIHUDRAFT_68296 [Emiliania huxleyi CCMP1516]|eukprot:XP_005760620.1 hypothetical protein EMIHUDRAFT_68296 [Emiliania huxleyi CCMP1516]